MEKAIIVLLLGILSLFVGALEKLALTFWELPVAAYVVFLVVNTNKWFYEKEVKGLNTLTIKNISSRLNCLTGGLAVKNYLMVIKPPLIVFEYQPVLPL